MQKFEAAEAGESFVRLLDDVRRGQTVLIETMFIEMDGQAVARLSPATQPNAGAEAEQRRVDADLSVSSTRRVF